MNPYQRLKTECTEWARKVMYPKTLSLWHWVEPAGQIRDLHQRVHAAQTLGYKVMLRATDDKLYAEYVKTVPEHECPWSIRP